ncbi:MAG: protein kinase [Deltaproteobacteria bacterium]|nr:protein kinase [Deltaproteobacteria bacterium]
MSNPLPPLAPDSFSGRRLGKYEIVCRLSTGGMSVIFLAFTRGISGFRKYVVLKQILPDVKGEDEFVRMFLDEAKITAGFNHPNIAQVFDLDVAEGELFLTMEFVPGATLVEVARGCRAAREPIPMGLALQSVRDTAVALHYAHTFTDPFGNPQPVIHRDIAEKNIMVTYEGVTKLLDFGIAKSLAGHSRTSVGMVKGTSGYMSPEQIRGEKLDARTDVFSLGVVLHELLTGVRLFAARSTEEALLAPLQQVVEPPSRQNPDVSPELDKVVLRCLERDRAARFGTALELARELERAVAPGTLWNPEESAAFMQRIFAERREQTRQLLSSSAAPSPSEMMPVPQKRVEPPPPAPPQPAPSSKPRNTEKNDPVTSRDVTSGYDDDELPGEPEPKPAAEQVITADVTGPTQAPLNRQAPAIKRRTSQSRPAVRLGPAGSPAPARPVAPRADPEAATLSEVSGPPRDSNVGLYAALGAAVLLVLAAAAWFVTSGTKAPPTPRDLPRAELPKPAPLPGRVLVPPDPPKPIPPPEPEEAPPAADAGPALLEDAGTGQQLPPDAGAVKEAPPAEPPRPAPSTPVAAPGQKPAARPPAQKKPEAVEAGAGFLTLVTTPFARVSLEGRDLGTTPLFKVALPAGTHALSLTSEDGAASQLSVTIKDGEVTAVRKNLSGGE